ncbi:hypothetical protein Amme_020_007 [Acidomonas methanolica NBRC 104435]|uniref:Uncharacterized protein n=1 Tax=Acidomonas methanolica NBRC 104435 TaxID=1231351 RepID=A0A023D2F3_ACIMT|nr:hypothetical protein Amme_020_007 [Acidomonas methanolica NBRC 104435]GEK98822.1 hypothetical protein AME01nite_13210 [Acidomonas methanolica NBRC 104435]
MRADDVLDDIAQRLAEMAVGDENDPDHRETPVFAAGRARGVSPAFASVAFESEYRQDDGLFKRM